MRQLFTLICGMIVLCSILLINLGCESKETAHVTSPSPQPVKEVAPTKSEPLRIGMGAMITPKEGYIYYQRLQAYIGKKLGRTVQLVDAGSYDEMNRLLETGRVDAAFVCAGPYVEGKKKFGMELLVMPLVKGKPVYYSYIIVHRNSKFYRFEDLRGKQFAFADPKSNSGKIVPVYILAKMGENPETFFSRYIYTYGHDQSIRAVAEGRVDGAAVDSLIWEYSVRRMPELTKKIRIIARSQACGIPPVVVRPGLDPELKRRLAEIFLTASTDPEGNNILKGMMIDRFVPGDDANYDSIRTMNRSVATSRKD